MSDEVFPLAGICRDKTYQSMQSDQSTQVSADWRMLHISQLPLSTWNATPQNLGTVCNVETNPNLKPAIGLPWLLPPRFSGDNSESELPPTSELFGSSLNFDPPVSGLNILTVSGVQECKSSQRSQFYVTFTGDTFDVEAMAFEFYEDKMEFENYDLVISMPGQESILNTESWTFFLDRLFHVPDGVDQYECDCEFEFFEEKLEFEENDLAMSFPGQESILDTGNLEVLCSKLMKWDSGEKNADTELDNKSLHMLEISSPRGCEANNMLEDISCHVKSSDSLAFGNESTAMERTPAYQNVGGRIKKVDDEHPLAAEAGREAAGPVPVELAPSTEGRNKISNSAQVPTEKCAIEFSKVLSLENDAAEDEEGWKTNDESGKKMGFPLRTAVGNALRADSRAFPDDGTLRWSENTGRRCINADSAVEQPRETSPSNFVGEDRSDESSLESDLAGGGATNENCLVSHQVSIEMSEEDSTRVRTANVKKRKNVFAGFVCAKIVKTFVTKFLLI